MSIPGSGLRFGVKDLSKDSLPDLKISRLIFGALDILILNLSES
jgi:hypothetical protein